MLDKVVGVIKGVGAAMKAAQVLEKKVKAFTDDTDLDGVPEYEEIKQELKPLIEDGKALALRVKAFLLKCLALAKHVAEA